MASLTLAIPPAVLLGGLLADVAELRAALFAFTLANAALAACAVSIRAARRL